MSSFWEIVFCVSLLFCCHVCLSDLKHAPSRELPLTAHKTVFSYLKCILSFDVPLIVSLGGSVDEQLEPWTCNSEAPTLSPTMIASIIIHSVGKAATFYLFFSFLPLPLTQMKVEQNFNVCALNIIFFRIKIDYC